MKQPTVLVTGATAGIGSATAMVPATRAARVIVTGRNPRRSDATVAALRHHAGHDRVQFLAADHAAVGGNHILARRVLASFGRLDVLVNKFGTAFRGRVLRMPINGEPETAADHGFVRARPRLILAALAGLLALALSACGTSGASTTAPAAEDGGPTVAIQDLAYTPERLTVPAGATVTWAFRDGAVAHDVEGDGFNSEVMAEGTFRHRFTQPGTYDYRCTLHPNMTGTIEVTR